MTVRSNRSEQTVAEPGLAAPTPGLVKLETLGTNELRLMGFFRRPIAPKSQPQDMVPLTLPGQRTY